MYGISESVEKASLGLKKSESPKIPSDAKPSEQGSKVELKSDELANSIIVPEQCRISFREAQADLQRYPKALAELQNIDDIRKFPTWSSANDHVKHLLTKNQIPFREGSRRLNESTINTIPRPKETFQHGGVSNLHRSPEGILSSYLEQAGLPKHRMHGITKKGLPDLPLIITNEPKSAILKMLENSKGVFWGESHSDYASKRLLADSLEDLKNAGVKRIYTEYFSSQEQDLLKDFNAGKINSDQLIPHMYGWLQAPGILDEHARIFDLARKQGIEFIGIDDYFARSSAERFSANKHWKAIVEEHESKNEGASKFLIFGGTAHLYDSESSMGLPSVFEIPGINVSVGSMTQAEAELGKKLGMDYTVLIPPSNDQRAFANSDDRRNLLLSFIQQHRDVISDHKKKYGLG